MDEGKKESEKITWKCRGKKTVERDNILLSSIKKKSQVKSQTWFSTCD